MPENFYLQQVINKGDFGSSYLREQTQKTLSNSEFVQTINGVSAVTIPADCYAVVHSAAGDSRIEDHEKYAKSLVENLVAQSNSFGAIPIGFSNIIDSNSGDVKMLDLVINAMVQSADVNKISILNGENAILGERVLAEVILTGTMISMISKSKLDISSTSIFCRDGAEYAVFDPENNPIVINSDGVGTKMDFYERIGKPELALRDLFAMNLDDAVKLHAKPHVVSCAFETNEPALNSQVRKYLQNLSEQIGVKSTLQCENAGNRLSGHSKMAFNLNGSAVSTIDEKMLHNLPKPKDGNFLVAIQGKTNPRSNGMTSRRDAIKIVAKSWSNQKNWHLTEKGRYFLEYLAEPSSILYPLFSDLLDEGLATAVFHLSGGAWNGKLAKPIAKENLFIAMNTAFKPDRRDVVFMEALALDAREAYAQWHMGNEGFVSTADPENAIRKIQKFGFRAICVGKLQKAKPTKGITFKAFNGEQIHFEGI